MVQKSTQVTETSLAAGDSTIHFEIRLKCMENFNVLDIIRNIEFKM